MSRATVFISYSHADEAWKDRVVGHLKVLEGVGLIDVWTDRQIGAGADWLKKIQSAMAAAQVAVLLISNDSLSSEFIREVEVPQLLKRHGGGRRDRSAARQALCLAGGRLARRDSDAAGRCAAPVDGR